MRIMWLKLVILLCRLNWERSLGVGVFIHISHILKFPLVSNSKIEESNVFVDMGCTGDSISSEIIYL